MLEIKALSSSSKGNAYKISDGVTTLLLEAGLKYKEIQKGFNFKMSEVSGCLLTHCHGDHSKSIKDVLNAGINVYASSGTFETLKLENHHRAKKVKSQESFPIGSWTILPFDVQHDVSEPLGFLLANAAGDKILFATDTYYIKYRFRGLTHLLIECNYSLEILERNIEMGYIPGVMKKRLLESHFSLENLKEFLSANDLSSVREIWLLHLSDSNSNAEMFKKEIMALTGKVVYVPE